MATCERLEKCPFFSGKMEAMPAVSDLIKQSFCLGDKTQCARYQVASAGIQAPADLFPCDQLRARHILHRAAT